MRRHILTLLLAVLALIALPGCTNWDEGTYSSDPLGELSKYYKTDVEETTPALTVFSLPYHSGETLDPITCGDGIQLTLASLLYEPLYRLTPQFETERVLAQSERYDPVTCTYTIRLRSDIRFSDGAALTAQDVADTLLRAQQSPRYAARLADVTDITAVDGSTLQIQLAADRQGFTALLDIPIVRSGSETGLIPVGTGPYRKAEDKDVLCRNTYWQRSDSLPFEEIGLLACKSEEAAAYAFSSHDVHLLACDLTGIGGDIASTSGSYTDADTAIFQYLGFNLSRGLFQDAAMRLAISMTVDRASIISAYLMGHGRAAQYPINPVSPLYPTVLDRSYTADDCAAAMAALNMADGEDKYDLTLLVNSENTFKVAAAQGIAQAMEQYDFNVTVSALPWEEYLTALSEGRFDLYYGECKLTADWDMLPLLGTGGALNYGGWSDSLTDAQLETCRTASDSGHADALKALCRRLQSQMPIVPICFKQTSVLLPYGAIDAITPTAADPFYALERWVVNWGTADADTKK